MLIPKVQNLWIIALFKKIILAEKIYPRVSGQGGVSPINGLTQWNRQMDRHMYVEDVLSQAHTD